MNRISITAQVRPKPDTNGLVNPFGVQAGLDLWTGVNGDRVTSKRQLFAFSRFFELELELFVRKLFILG